MKPQELYALQPIEVNYHFNYVQKALAQVNDSEGYAVPLAELFSRDIDYDQISVLEEKKLFKIHFYMNEGDDKYGAILYGVYFNDEPFMVVKNNGRWYEQFDPYVTNLEVYHKAEKFLVDFLFNQPEKLPSIYHDDMDIDDLHIIDNYNFHDYYDANLQAQYQVGDEVWAWVSENHLKYSFANDYKGYVLTKVVIGRIKPFSPDETYWGQQVERGWDDNRAMVLKLDGQKGGVGATFSDALIVGKVNEIDMPKHAVNHYVNEKGELPDNYAIKLEQLKEILAESETQKHGKKMKP
jgi:hypothetical protein